MGGGSNHYIRAEKHESDELAENDADSHFCDKTCWRNKTMWIIIILTIVAAVTVTVLVKRKNTGVEIDDNTTIPI